MATREIIYNIEDLIEIVETQTKIARDKIEEIRQRGDNISIADMFDVQMDMNHLAQVSEMSTSVVNASNTAIMSMARNVKG